MTHVQPPQASRVHEAWTAATGLPGLNTNRLLTAKAGSDGTLWIINEQYRLLRFRDGRFTRLAADSVGDVQTTVEDRAGRTWVATTKGLAIVRGGSVVPIGRETLSGPVLSVILRRDGVVWVGGRAGVGPYRVAAGDRIDKIPVDSSLESDEIQTMHEDSLGTLWLGTSRGSGPGASNSPRFARASALHSGSLASTRCRRKACSPQRTGASIALHQTRR